jgi:hypothetical protein
VNQRELEANRAVRIVGAATMMQQVSSRDRKRAPNAYEARLAPRLIR